MPASRPTFHESWHRVADLRPRLRREARVTRQRFRGRTWHVAEDDATGQFFRISDAAWSFVGLLDGRRTVAEAWRMANESRGDDAPTQGEAIHLLSQLSDANLLHVEAPPDARALLRRRRERRTREAKSFLAGYLFFRVPLIDPDRFLDAALPLVAWMFTPAGFVLWLAWLAAGAWQLAGRADELLRGVGGALDSDNLPALAITFALVKLAHEFGHAFACKALGRREGAGGAVHTMGVMFLLFFPAPYADTTSAWAFRSKLRRIIVGAAGMMVELAVAAGAAFVWTRSPEDSLAHALAWNVIFLAGVTTLLFNLNPLVRFDGYFMLSDWLETPNLSRRAYRLMAHLVKKFAWGLRRDPDPSHSPGERAWLLVYGVASAIYRVLLCAGILIAVLDQQLLLGAALVLVTAALWLVAPLVRFVRYLAASSELARRRRRAVLTTLGAAAAIALVLGVPRLPRSITLEGVIEPAAQAEVYAPADGFVERVARTGDRVTPGGEPIVVARSPEWEARRATISAELDRAAIERRAAIGADPARAAALESQIDALAAQKQWADDTITALAVRAPIAGVWMPAPAHDPACVSNSGAIRRGERLGRVIEPATMRVRAGVRQDLAAMLVAEARPAVRFRALSDPSRTRAGRIERTDPAPLRREPRAHAGEPPGSDPAAPAIQPPALDMLIATDEADGLRPGQLALVRVRVADASILERGRQWLARTLQQRFRTAPLGASAGSAIGSSVP